MRKTTKITASLLLIVIFSLGTLAQQYTKLSDFPEEIKKSKPFKRFEWMYTQRAFPYDTIPSIKANKNMIEACVRERKSNNTPNGSKDHILWIYFALC